MAIKLEVEVTDEKCISSDFVELAELELAAVGGGMGDVAF